MSKTGEKVVKKLIKNQGEKWSLFRLADRKQFDGVSLETIEFFYRVQTEKTRVDWLMWRDGFTGWRPLGELSQILIHLQNDEVHRVTPPPVPESVSDFKISASDEETLSLMLESQAATDDRDNVRYQKHFKVRIFTPKGVVLLETIDCSTSGFRLKGPLPTGLSRFFNVELDLGPDGKIPLVCSEVREKDGSKGARVRIQVNDHMNVLKSVLFRAA